MAATVVLAGANSGSGKTTITCGLLYGLRKLGKSVCAFKCGPDYIDPMFHRKVLSTASYNLDSFFLNPGELTKHFIRHTKTGELCVVEGVMGYYDGVGYTTKGSTYEVAGILNAPVVLVVNGRGMANSLAALIQGFQSYRKPSGIRGVILNQVSPATYERMKEELVSLGLVPCGYLPKLNKDLIIENRHLGLITANEIQNFQSRMEVLWSVMKETVDVEEIIKIASKQCFNDENPASKAESFKEKQESLYREEESLKPGGGEAFEKVRIAVAKDEAFSFIYQENMEVLEDLGCELVYFSPVHSRELPESIAGMVLPGGYPELYAAQLSENVSLRTALYRIIKKGIPVLAECGGYMYLKEELEDAQGVSYPMVGILPGKCYRTDHLVRFGYVTLTAQRDNLLGKAETVLKAHEFHYWDSAKNGDSYRAKKTSGNEGLCVYATDHLFAGFPHLYYPANREAIANFVRKCREWKKD